jgi:hypothetical protein
VSVCVWATVSDIVQRHSAPFFSPPVLQTSTMWELDQKLRAYSVVLILASFISCFVNSATIQVTNRHSGVEAYKEKQLILSDTLSKMIVIIHLCFRLISFLKL